MKCPKCQKQYEQEDLRFCRDCGVPLEEEAPVVTEEEPAPQTPKKKKRSPLVVVLIVLALVLLVPLVLVLAAGVIFLIIALIAALIFGINVFNVVQKEAVPLQPPVSVVTTVPDAVATLPSMTDPTTAPTEARIEVPYCVGKSEEEATALLQEAGLAVTVIYEYNNFFAAGTVDSTVPEAGMTCARGDEVTVYVSKGSETSPYAYNQLVKVTAPVGSSYGQLQVYDWIDGDWALQFRCSATVGQNGIGSDYGEGKGVSPAGVFPIGVAFAADGVDTYGWPVERVTLDTCIVDDVNSPYYNTVQSISELPDGVSYDTIGNTVINGFSGMCVFIEHNGDGYSSEGVVPGKGSVITICSKYGALEPTAGCVDISTEDMATLLQCLDISQNPYIEFATE